MKQATFKRRELINTRVTFYFILFILVSIFTVGFFMTEDYKLNVVRELTLQQNPGGAKFFPAAIFLSPMNLGVIFLWILCCTVFALAFNRRLKPMFSVFFWLSFAVVLIFCFWNYLISLAVASSNSRLVSFILQFNYSNTYKLVLLLIWCFFSIFISFSYVTTKYVGIFTRLDYLFNSIMRGNWDSIMFFRTGDHFAFLAPTFNDLKDAYLKKIYSTDEVLIQVKDKLHTEKFDASMKKEMVEALRNSCGGL